MSVSKSLNDTSVFRGLEFCDIIFITGSLIIPYYIIPEGKWTVLIFILPVFFSFTLYNIRMRHRSGYLIDTLRTTIKKIRLKNEKTNRKNL